VHRLALTLALALLLLAGCGGGGDDAGAPQPATGATTESTESETGSETLPPPPAPGESTSFGVFFLRDGKVAPVYWAVPRTEAVATAALEALFAGPSPEEAAAGVETAIPAGTQLESINVMDGVATVDLSLEFDALREPASLDPSLAQITFPLTQFPTIRRVWVAVLGEPIGSQRRPMTRATFPELVPLILVEHPALGEEVTSPVTVSGTASVFEATLRVRLEDPDGMSLFEDTVTATEGAPGRGSFAIEIPFTEEGPATIVAFSPSAKDGTEQHAFAVPVVLAP
jgi:Immunoglobulin-like domain of bacterial spore germination/Sporulation and spore germination